MTSTARSPTCGGGGLGYHLGMMSFIDGLYRKLRFGKPIIVVSGLPRSGTSMAMKMLEAGGVPIVTDGKRTADESNPKGYYEFEPVMRLHEDPDKRWLTDVRGKAVKIISFLLPSLPEAHHYKVVFMHRDLREVMASQSKMLAKRGEEPGANADGDTLIASYRKDVEKTKRLLARRPCFDVLDVDYKAVLEDAAGEAARIAAFIGGLDADAMEAVVDQQLYRNRRS
ncbi:MAG: sulfotransferase [SAR202 cluster bacterium]|nr:sulfotransferase [SAR202 cluster bacterium]